MSRNTQIAQLMTNVESGIKISRLLYEKNLMLDAVDLKTKFTELLSLLTEIKLAIFDMQEFLNMKEKQIIDLENAIKFKDTLVCKRDAYYVMDQKGKAIGDAHCVKCWENTYKKRKLIVKPDDAQLKICPTCGQIYSRIETENIKKKFRWFG